MGVLALLTWGAMDNSIQQEIAEINLDREIGRIIS